MAIYSFFVLWRDKDYNLCRLHLAGDKPHNEYGTTELLALMKARCKELKQPFNLPEDAKFRTFDDPR